MCRCQVGIRCHGLVRGIARQLDPVIVCVVEPPLAKVGFRQQSIRLGELRILFYSGVENANRAIQVSAAIISLEQVAAVQRDLGRRAVE